MGTAMGDPVGTTLGSLSVVKNTDTTGLGSGGQLTWTYTVAVCSAGSLRQTKFDCDWSSDVCSSELGSVITKQIDVTITGTNDAPVITAQDLIGAVTEQVSPA